MTPQMQASQRKFFERYFPTPGAVHLGVWMSTALGDLPLDQDFSLRAGFQPGAIMFDYADALIEYSHSRGWYEELEELLQQDVRDNLDEDSNIAYA